MASLLKIASRKIHREQEKLMQKLGGKGEQTDEAYQEHLENFSKQQKHAERLLKETQNYLKNLQGLVAANKALGDAVKVVYEPDWSDSESIYKAVEEMDLMYADIHDKLAKHVAEPLSAYLQRFPDIRARIAKRDRKALDFSAARRAVDSARDKGGPKLQQAEEAFAEVEKTYSEINTELHEMLPNFYQGRMSFYSSIMQTMFAENANFHKSCEKINEELRVSMDKFLEVESSGLHTSKPITTRITSMKRRPDGTVATTATPSAASGPATAPGLAAVPFGEESDEGDSKVTVLPPAETKVEAEPAKSTSSAPAAAAAATTTTSTSNATTTPPVTAPAAATAAASTSAPAAGGEGGDDVKVLEKRLATHAYDATDDDELTFVKGDIIEVLPTPDPEDIDDGWLYGRLKGRVGVFPKNFTGDYTE